MVTVQHLVKKELENNWILLDMMQQDLLNINAVAEKLHHNIEKSLGRKVKLSAISMAIRRYSEEFSSKNIFKWKFPEDLEISTKSNIYEIAIKKDSNLSKSLEQIRSKMSNQVGSFLSLVDGIHETVFFTNQSNKNNLKSILRSKEITSERDNLGYVSINFQEITKEIPGIYYRITRVLALKNISIQSMHTIGAEVIFLFKDEVLMEAYKSIKNLIENKSNF